MVTVSRLFLEHRKTSYVKYNQRIDALNKHQRPALDLFRDGKSATSTLSRDRRTFSLFTALATFLLGITFAGGALAADNPHFGEDVRDGWHFYRDPPPVNEEEPEAEIPVQPAAAATPPMPPEAAEPAEVGPTPLSTAWLRERLPQALEAAIDEPSTENVETFALLQRLSLDRSRAFAEAMKSATIGNPLLDATFERPLSPRGVQQVDRSAGEARNALLKDMSRTVGVMIFVDSTCALCETQVEVLEQLQRLTGIESLVVTLDGAPLTSGAMRETTVVDAGQAAAMGVPGVPAVYLMRPPDGLIPVGAGPYTYSDLIQRTVLLARSAGWVSEEAYQTTRTARSMRRPVTPHDIPQDVLDDPARLSAYLTAMMRKP
ncbi:MAG: conjugal transfer protein TraF [Pseudomonadota bacterium]